ncbi:UPF0182 family protein [uncultured Pseudokineococcus sp.]|uniref:UPF0182 family membrane protein n=1 Tax=uncultured Pseudokineococcus sp. TaxID=1642928 RepID=UPI002633BFBA|nr:UPF0182 family protein [uncultured Pseudokineococcus sp.]
MSSSSSTSPPRRRGALLPAVAVVVALVGAVVVASQVVTEYGWFQQVGFADVYRTRLLTQGALFLAGAVVMAVAVLVSLRLAYGSRPVYAPVDAESANLDRYRESLEPLRRLLSVAVPVVLGLFAGSAASAQWEQVLLFLNGTPFEAQDPVFSMDVGFWVFTLPFLDFLVSFLTAVVLLAGIAGAMVHYLYGGLRLQGRGPRTTTTARVQLAVTAGLLVLLQAASYWLDRYSELTDDSGRFLGATYTGVNAEIPGRAILAVIALLVAVLFFATAFRGSWRLPALGVVVMLASAVVVGGIYPYVVQRFQVDPSALTRETPYLQNNIDATRAAYDLDSTEVTNYEASTEAEAGALRDDAETTANIRVLDPAIVQPAFQQDQRQRQYYTFSDPLDVDRYDIDGQTEDAVIGVRELDLSGLSGGQRSWVNEATIFTHGYGVVAAYGNQRGEGGLPAYFQAGINAEGALGDFEPRIYFGQNSPPYSIVGAPEGTDPREVDYPTDEEGGDGVANNTYSGDGGPSVGSWWQRLLYAVKFQEQNILLSDALNSESQILYDRDPRDRVAKVAPFLTLDGDPYPAVVDDRVLWIIDGYTTSNEYPYSDRETLADATLDSQNAGLGGAAGQAGAGGQGGAQTLSTLPPEEVNYIRNSVKATVDAYSGDVVLYAWDSDDPVLQAWDSVFPDALTDVSEMSQALLDHVRYPDDLFKVQRSVLGAYHVTNPAVFFQNSDRWQIPADPTADVPEGVPAPLQPAYYLTLQMPGQEEPAFSLTSTYIPNSSEASASNILTGFLAVDGDAGGAGAGQVAEGYGQMRLLQLPRNLVINGPGQVQNDFDADPTISTELNLLSQNNTDVAFGNLLTLPVGGGLLYVQPVYVQSSGGTQIPRLQYALVSFGNEIGFAQTLDEALNQVFGGDSGATAGDAGLEGDGAVPPAADDPADGGDAVVGADVRTQLQQALQDAQAALTQGQEALSGGDFAAYGETQQQLADAVSRAVEAQQEIDGAAEAAPAAEEPAVEAPQAADGAAAETPAADEPADG